MNPIWAYVALTAVLVIITAYYAWQTYKMRKESVKPNFSLVPRGMQFLSGGRQLNGLFLRNSGGVARDIDVVLRIEELEEEFHTSSLIQNEEVELIGYEDIGEIDDENKTVTVDITFKDGYGDEDSDNLEIDFGKSVRLQSVPILDELKNIKKEIDDIGGT